MNCKLVIRREHPHKDVQIFTHSEKGLRTAAKAALSTLAPDAVAVLYKIREEEIGRVRLEQAKDGKVQLVPVQEQEEEKANETGKAGNEASSSASNNAGK